MAWLNSLGEGVVASREAGFIGIAMLILVLLVLYGAIVFRKRVELPALLLLSVAAVISNIGIVSILYFIASLLIAFAWFFYWRKPPILRL